MDVIYSRCCGLDIHKKTVVACLISSAPGQQPEKEVRTFRAMTAELLALADCDGKHRRVLAPRL
jgi:transposase